jgi:hypothetical protein
MDRWRRTHCMASMLATFESSGFLPVVTPKNPYVCSQLTTKRHFTIALWMPVRVSTTTLPSLNRCGGPWWDVLRRSSNLMEDIFSTYYKCTLSAITHKLSVSKHMLIWKFFLVLVYGTRAQSLSAPFSYNLYMDFSIVSNNPSTPRGNSFASCVGEPS